MQAARPLTKPTKQRKMIFQAPAHIRHRLLAAHLSPELRTSHGVKSFPVRTGDTVRVMRGDHKGVEGKITRVNLKKYRIYVEGLTREKVDGTTVFVPIHPSKVIVTRLSLDDKWRKEILEIKKERLKKAEKPPRKPEAKPKLKPEEKPKEVEEVQKVVEEKRAVREKARKKIAGARKKPARKKAEEKVKAEAKEAAKEAAKEEEKPKPKPKKRTRRTTRKTAKKTEEGEE